MSTGRSGNRSQRVGREGGAPPLAPRPSPAAAAAAAAVESTPTNNALLFDGDMDPVSLEVPTIVAEWPKCFPDTMIQLFQNLNERVLGGNQKKLYSIYRNWETMKELQRSNTMAFFHKLDTPTQVACVKRGQE